MTHLNNWSTGVIPDCTCTPLRKFNDPRGWLAEIFREDELEKALWPAMAYLSLTEPGIARGPHAHEDQTDLFVFFDGLFEVHLWDNRLGVASFGIHQVLLLGEEQSATLLVPPGVVHGYRNVSEKAALILNCPNRLYAGKNKKEPVDEIRHEDDLNTPFII
ncbi:MAG: dTDP-4-dehydrorhamnose 3,5-epimerase family protein [Bacteroidetes Order II. Incertae sedis bacterium]|nr:dTDP-4-dehydrorhamnose 3,5-epimerase family protein [Bacteroidetes Order II. bacterium]